MGAQTESPILQRMMGTMVAAGDRRITVRFDRVYGKVVCYPACAVAHEFAAIARTKTLSYEVISAAQRLGFQPTTNSASLDLLDAFLRSA